MSTIEPPITTVVGGLVIRHWPVADVEANEPKVCSPAQGLVALYAIKGITEANIQAAIETIADPATRYAAEVGLKRSTEWRRDSQTTQMLAALLSLSESDLDALFAHAVTIQI